MSVTFHDGTNKLYNRYAPQPWNDVGLLRLNPDRNGWDDWLMKTYNKEDGIRALLQGESALLCRPYGKGSKLGEYISAENTGILILKGLHQWKRIGKTWNYKLHLSFGLDGWIWHLDARYEDRSGTISLTGTCTKGERATAEDHEGFVAVKGRRR
jgi:hypothetical protein